MIFYEFVFGFLDGIKIACADKIKSQRNRDVCQNAKNASFVWVVFLALICFASGLMQKFAVIGSPITHSLSPIIHNFLFSHFALPTHYDKIHLLDSKDLHRTLTSLAGANITLPYKEEAFRVCDEVEGIAQKIGAVNTTIYRDGRLRGFNTDGFGFWECIKGLDIKNALILGAGGSARAIAVILKERGIDVAVYNRTLEKMGFFDSLGVEVLSGVVEGDLRGRVAEVQRQERLLGGFDLVIHTTSVGLDGGSVPYGEGFLSPILKGAKWVFDVIYPPNPKIADIEGFKHYLRHRPQTAFVRFAKRGVDGLDMLLYQALFAFEIFSEGRYCFDELKALFYNPHNQNKME